MASRARELRALVRATSATSRRSSRRCSGRSLEPPKWFEYAPQFLSQHASTAASRSGARNAAALARAEAEYGVPAEIIVAIIGVETFYGRNTGGYRVIDALTTLAFDYPRRASFFRGELQRVPAAGARPKASRRSMPKGSFAGAIGVPQFMPGSVRRYAVDFDGDGHIDLWHSDDDAIGSVANYLARHDWLRGQPVWSPATIDDVAARRGAREARRRHQRAAPARGVERGRRGRRAPARSDVAAEPVGLLALEEAPDATASRCGYWIAFPNFYVITRYNKSRLYAAAVTSLAEAIRAKFEAPTDSALR